MKVNTKPAEVSEALTLAGSKMRITLQDAAARTSRTVAMLIVAGAVLSLIQSTAFAGTISSFGPAINPSGCATTPAPSTLGNTIFVSLSPACDLEYFYSGGQPTLYPLKFVITNNTGQTMTDLEINLLSLETPSPFFSSAVVTTPSPTLPISSQGPAFVDFLGSLANGSSETVTVNLTVATLVGSGQDAIQFLPSFTPVGTPEPTSLALGLSGAVFIGVGAWRRRRARAYLQLKGDAL